MDVARLQAVGVFSGLSKKELERLSSWTDELTVREGEDLVTEGRFAHEFFVIEGGTADVLKDGQRIAELGPGDFFGEIGLLETERRTATGS
jgi:CRP/FNR family transcriptional regulator, cyclic AMP receptor protein